MANTRSLLAGAILAGLVFISACAKNEESGRGAALTAQEPNSVSGTTVVAPSVVSAKSTPDAPAPSGDAGTETEFQQQNELTAFAAAKPVFEEYCTDCHTTGKKKSKKREKALKHFNMDSYPFGGHHADELGAAIREVLGVDGGKISMPKDDKGAVAGADLELVVAWSRAFDAAHPSQHDNHRSDHERGDGHQR